MKLGRVGTSPEWAGQTLHAEVEHPGGVLEPIWLRPYPEKRIGRIQAWLGRDLPGLLPILGTTTLDGQLWVVYPQQRAVSLGHLAPLPPQPAAELIATLCAILASLGRDGPTHPGPTLEDVLVGCEGRVWLVPRPERRADGTGIGARLADLSRVIGATSVARLLSPPVRSASALAQLADHAANLADHAPDLTGIPLGHWAPEIVAPVHLRLAGASPERLSADRTIEDTSTFDHTADGDPDAPLPPTPQAGWPLPVGPPPLLANRNPRLPSGFLDEPPEPVAIEPADLGHGPTPAAWALAIALGVLAVLLVVYLFVG